VLGLELESVFQQVGILLIVCVLAGALAQRLRQPLIIAFIAVGILAGPFGMGVIEDTEQLDLFAEIGIALLLFVVGLKLDLHLIRTVGPVALVAGLGQVAFTSLVGFGIALALGLEPVTATYVAVALTFSSTIIIVKLLSDKQEVEETHGKVALGILIVQDIVVVAVLITLSAFGDTGEGGGLLTELGLTAFRGVVFVAVLGALMRWVLPGLLERLARERELLMLFAIAWAVGLAAMGAMLGFSEEVGAFLAGISLASTGYRDAIGGRLVSVRDFLMLFFFVTLGIQLDFGAAGEQLVEAVVLSLFVLVGNPLIVLTIMAFMGYRARTGFLTGLTVAQISEFSLIFAALGLAVGHIDEAAVGLITLVGITTIGLSTYLILYSKEVYRPMAGVLERVFQRRRIREKDLRDALSDEPADYVVIGLGRFGRRLAEHLDRRGVRVLGVDHDPQVVRQEQQRGVSAVFGDASDPELVSHLPLQEARWIVITSPDLEATLTLVDALKRTEYACGLSVAARNDVDAGVLERAGVDNVLFPLQDAAEEAAVRLEELRPARTDRDAQRP
jgi:Kef-type K+ transport system membrane component KefB